MNKWDEKAQHYGRYNPKLDGFEKAVFEMLEDLEVDFSGKRTIDIGCGTGVYTLHIAQKASSVDAVDISCSMLEVLQSDAEKYNIDNITTHCSDWLKFNLPPIKYDFAISTMSPATRDPNSFQKMHKCADTKIFLGWDDKRGTELIEELFELHNASYTPPNGAVKLKSWLAQNSIDYKIKQYVETKVRVRPLQRAVQRYGWHLEARGIKPDKTKIEKFLRSKMDLQGNITETVQNYFNLIVWC